MTRTLKTNIYRDSFARMTLVRARTDRQAADCEYCGQPARFRYAWEQDRIGPDRPYWSRPFCSVGCYRAFHA